MDAAADEQEEEVLFSLGVIADVQYANRPDVGTSFGGKQRFYADGLRKAAAAGKAWAAAGCVAAINVGDTIDRSSKDPSADLSAVVAAFAGGDGGFKGQMLHVFGNHEASCMDRAAIVQHLAMPASATPTPEADAAYYDFCPAPKFRVVALDTYDMGMASRRGDPARLAASSAMLEAGKARGEVQFMDHPELNGGVGPAQLAWLRTVIAAAERNDERVIVFGHCPLYAPVTMDGYTVCWNHQAVLDVVTPYKGVKLCLGGHDHEGALRVQWKPHCLFHLCLEAALESPPGTPCHGVLDVYRDRLVVRGTPTLRDRLCKQPPVLPQDVQAAQDAPGTGGEQAATAT